MDGNEQESIGKKPADTNKSGETSLVCVDVVIPVHNASGTVEEAARSALEQVWPSHLKPSVSLDIAVCCQDDGSKDGSLEKLLCLKEKFDKEPNREDDGIVFTILIGSNKDGLGRGAGYARNRAASLRKKKGESHFICLLDSDDTMHPYRVAEQVHQMLSLSKRDRSKMILGCQFDRDPPDSTWHYASWLNGLSDERLALERFREVTLLQPTWMIARSWFEFLGGYVEAPHPDSIEATGTNNVLFNDGVLRLIHKNFDSKETLRLAEDLRFFHAHLHAGGLLRLHRTMTPLLTYRHRAGMSQSSQTPRKLLLHLRVLAFETCVLRPHWLKGTDGFVVWGAGRDGKDFVKALSADLRKRITCFVDVDPKKIDTGHYFNKEMNLRIPIVHFSWLIPDAKLRTKLQENESEEQFGRIRKSRDDEADADTPKIRNRDEQPSRKKRKVADRSLDISVLPRLPIVVCVAMYRTGGALERNVEMVGRKEGENLWHFS